MDLLFSHQVRFCGLLNLDFQTLKAAKTMAYNAKPVENSVNATQKLYPWDGRNPSTIAAAILYIICGLSKVCGRLTAGPCDCIASAA